MDLHGERVMIASEAHRIRNRLDADILRGPLNPETGFAAEAAEAAKRGRGNARTPLQVGTARAYAQRMSLTRAHRKHGGQEEYLH